MLENKVDYTFYRDTVETHAGRPITDKEWEVISSEMEDALDYHFGDMLASLWDNIEHLVSQDEKCD